ncbi:hypothetical protein [Neobacillus niacini]|uniref:hypothetical protein n=1 Tax=Neobacillus niacini TaxID=86668 RepID=UPI0005F00783|nr:hypothetical protein [Neobacillus niacini]
MLRGRDALFYGIVLGGIDDFLDYLDELDDKINKEKITLETNAEGLSKEDQLGFWFDFADEHDKYEKIFPAILRKSIFTSLFSYFEHQLFNMCKDKEKLKSIKNVYGLDKAKEYLSKIENLGEIFKGREWNIIKQYSQVRNCIVHAGGIIYLMSNDGEQQSVRNFIKATKGIIINQGDVIELETNFCKEFGSVAGDFLEIIHISMKNH